MEYPSVKVLATPVTQWLVAPLGLRCLLRGAELVHNYAPSPQLGQEVCGVCVGCV